MSTSLKNGTIATGGTAQDIAAERLGRTSIAIMPQDEDLWINFGQNAAVDGGELVPVRSMAIFDVVRFPEVGGRVSVVSPTTGAKFQFRDV